MANNGTFEILDAVLRNAPRGSQKFVSLFVSFEVDRSDGKGTVQQSTPVKVFDADLCKTALGLNQGQTIKRIAGALGRSQFKDQWSTDLVVRELEL